MKNLFRFLILAIILFGGLGVTAVFADKGATFALKALSSTAAPQNQSYYIFDGEAGARLESSIRIVNTGTAAGVAYIYPVDMTTGQTGGAIFLLRDDPREVTGSWITLEVNEVTLAAGESRDIPFSVLIPADARPGHHLGGIVAEAVMLVDATTVSDSSESASFQVKVQNRNAMAVQVNLPGTAVERMEAVGIVAGGQRGYQTLALGLSNSGNVMLKPSGQLTISDANGRQLQDLHFSLDTFLPETTIYYPLFVENEALPAGEYLAELTLYYGTEREMTRQLNFAITQAEVNQVFDPRGALDAPASAAEAAAAGVSWRDLFLGGLIAFNVALVLVGFILYRRRKQTAAV
jgi:hypothetical protein